mmetsp:Transcript_29986/g.72232  ORF Transcript_29986/g.72232 Transcript_29986/m.72232 type:complete len:236 (-) Transcript_29986:330-1037(-)
MGVGNARSASRLSTADVDWRRHSTPSVEDEHGARLSRRWSMASRGEGWECLLSRRWGKAKSDSEARKKGGRKRAERRVQKREEERRAKKRGGNAKSEGRGRGGRGGRQGRKRRMKSEGLRANEEEGGKTSAPAEERKEERRARRREGRAKSEERKRAVEGSGSRRAYKELRAVSASRDPEGCGPTAETKSLLHRWKEEILAAPERARILDEVCADSCQSCQNHRGGPVEGYCKPE